MKRPDRPDQVTGSVPSGNAVARPVRPSFAYGAFVAALSALALGLVAARGATYGANLYLEIPYASAAVSLLDGLGFSGGPFVEGIDAISPSRAYTTRNLYCLWPPLWPLLLAAAGLLGLEIPAQMHWAGAVSFALSVFAVGRFAGRRFSSRFFRVWTPLVAALSLPFAEYAWAGISEPPFVLFTLLALTRLDHFLDRGRRSSLVWSAVFAALAFQTRYAGLVLPAFAGALLLLRPGARAAKRGRDAALYALIAGLPMAPWFLRNYLLTGTLTGPRPPMDYAAPEILGGIARGIGSWASFEGSPFILLVGGALIPLAALLLPKRPRGPGRPHRPARPDLAPSASFGRTTPILIFGGFILTYLAFYFTSLMLGQTRSGVEARHLFPVYPPLLLALSSAFDLLFRAERERRLAASARTRRHHPIDRCRRFGLGAAAGLLSAWAAGQVLPHREAIVRANSPEVRHLNGLLGEPWASSETMRFLRAERASDPPRIYTNRRRAIVANAGAVSLHLFWNGEALTEGSGGALSTPQERLATWLGRAPEGAWVVWTTDFLTAEARAGPRAAWSDAPGRPDYLHRVPAALFAAPGLRPLAEFDDGAVFVVDRTYDPAPDRYRQAYEFLRTREPDAASDFEVVLGRVPGAARDGPLLSYLRTPCRKEFLQARFFLHLWPEDPGVLPPERAPHVFENLDFDFLRLGVLLDLGGGEHACVALVPLPDYEISRVRTGQHRSGEGAIWSAEIHPE